MAPPSRAPQRRPGVAVLHSAACEVFAERGLHGASVRDIAHRAGVSMAALYHYYAGKEELLDAVLTEASENFFHACEDALGRAGDASADRLAALVGATITHLVRHRVQSSLLMSGIGDPDRRRQAARAGSRLFEEVIEDGVQCGDFRTPYPANARRMVEAACSAIVQWYDPGGTLSLEALIDQHVHLALTAVECVRRAGPGGASFTSDALADHASRG